MTLSQRLSDTLRGEGSLIAYILESLVMLGQMPSRAHVDEGDPFCSYLPSYSIHPFYFKFYFIIGPKVSSVRNLSFLNPWPLERDIRL